MQHLAYGIDMLQMQAKRSQSGWTQLGGLCLQHMR